MHAYRNGESTQRFSCRILSHIHAAIRKVFVILSYVCEYVYIILERSILVPRPSIKEDGLVPIATMLVRMRWPIPKIWYSYT